MRRAASMLHAIAYTRTTKSTVLEETVELLALGRKGAQTETRPAFESIAGLLQELHDLSQQKGVYMSALEGTLLS